MPFDSPTVTRRLLSAELRKLREHAHLTLDDVAQQLEWSESKVSRIENASWKRLSATDLRALLAVYKMPKDQVDKLVAVARTARKRGWWHIYGDAVPAWFETYVGLEGAAHTLSNYEAEIVPGLLQTDAYARAVYKREMLTEDDAAVQREVEVRMDRQRLLTDPNPPTLWAILNEAVLHRQVGGEHVMRKQLRRLVDAAKLPNVTLQVLPFSTGAHPAMDEPFMLLGFDEPALNDLVYLEHQTGSLYLEKPRELERYTLVFDRLRADALGVEASLNLIERLAKET